MITSAHATREIKKGGIGEKIKNLDRLEDGSPTLTHLDLCIDNATVV